VDYEFVLTHRFAALGPTLDRLEELLKHGGFDRQVCSEMRLIAEEVIMNILSYAYDDIEEPIIQVTLACRSGEVHLRFVDKGRPFNPLDQPGPDPAATVERRCQGGLGIALMRALCSDLSYCRHDGQNILTLRSRPGSSPAAGGEASRI
jgi:anti-sigma regulatory factor (Ser/Thr protein kinase)